MNNTDKQKDKSRRSQAGFYAVVMVCLIAIGATALVAHQSSQSRGDEDDIGAPNQTLQADVNENEAASITPQITDNEPSSSAPDSAPKTDAATQPNDGSDIRSAGADAAAPDDSVAASGTITAKKYSKPISGKVITPHSGDELVYSATLDDWRIHSGTDYKASVGEAVRAIADGTIKRIFCDDLMGWCVAVSHDGSLMSYYYNLSPEIGVKEGQSVKMGDTLGGVGESASAESAIEPHLHLEVTKSSKQIDPESLFK